MEWKDPPMMEWIDTPPGRRHGAHPGKWKKATDKLKANPNRWALIGTTKHPSTAYTIGNRYGVRIVVRVNKSRTFDIYGIAEEEREK